MRTLKQLNERLLEIQKSPVDGGITQIDVVMIFLNDIYVKVKELQKFKQHEKNEKFEDLAKQFLSAKDIFI